MVKDSESMSSIPKDEQRFETKAGFEMDERLFGGNGEKLTTELANIGNEEQLTIYESR
jgi:hypothetical protein